MYGDIFELNWPQPNTVIVKPLPLRRQMFLQAVEGCRRQSLVRRSLFRKSQSQVGVMVRVGFGVDVKVKIELGLGQ